MKDKVLFDDWSEVKDCNGCEHYWNKLCDGTKVGSEKRCTAFKATRKVDIPLEIKALKSSLKWLRVSVFCVAVALLIHLIGGLV